MRSRPSADPGAETEELRRAGDGRNGGGHLFFNFRHNDVDNDQSGVRHHLNAFKGFEILDKNGLADLESADININLLGNIGRQTTDLESPREVLERAA